jgi:hypothetical protein
MTRRTEKIDGRAIRVTACFSQMGGLRGLLPLLTNAADFDIRWYGREPALSYIRSKGHEARHLGKLRLDPNACDVLLTDTINLSRSDEGIHCREAWICAAENGVPSVAFVDCWWGYMQRFTLFGERLADAPLPDVIAVVDEIAHKDMVALGFPENRLQVLGSPWLSSLVQRHDSCRHCTREELDLRAEEFVLTFVSQPLARILNDRDSWGFTEQDVLPSLLRACNHLPPEVLGRLRVLCLAHPEEDEQALVDLVRAETPAFPVQVRKDPDPLELIRASDLVTGMFSILLVEAALCDVPVLSIQPGLKREDMLVTNRTGATLALRQGDQLPQLLRRMACDAPSRAHRLEQQRLFPVIAESRTRWTNLLHNLATFRNAQA